MDLTRSIEQLDGDDWGDAPEDATGLVKDVHRLRRVSIGDLSNGDLRMLLGQQVGLPWLIPIALERLNADPMAGDWYPGDLIRAVLHGGVDYWARDPEALMHLWSVRESLEKLRTDIAAV